MFESFDWLIVLCYKPSTSGETVVFVVYLLYIYNKIYSNRIINPLSRIAIQTDGLNRRNDLHPTEKNGIEAIRENKWNPIPRLRIAQFDVTPFILYSHLSSRFFLNIQLRWGDIKNGFKDREVDMFSEFKSFV